jgi:hypothetical protein
VRLPPDVGIYWSLRVGKDAILLQLSLQASTKVRNNT